MMRAAFLTPSISRRAGGIADCVRHLASVLQDGGGVEARVFSLLDAHTAADRPAWAALPTVAFAPMGPASFGYAPGLRAALARAEPDLVHTHGLWTYLSVAGRAWHRRTRRPYLVAPHGMLDPWAVNNSRWKKRLAAGAFERAHLRGAACLHALCEAERAAIRAYGLTNPVCVIPNGVELPDSGEPGQPAPWAEQVEAGRKILLYLGRLHPKKGLATLLRAWAAAGDRNRPLAEGWCLVLAGWDQGGHQQELRRLAAGLGLGRRVAFPGPLFGEAKAAAYRSADACVLPSLSEGLPLVVLEAWSYRLPVLMTPQCNLPEGFAAGAAWRAEPEAASLAAALETLMRASDGDRRAMGEKGRRLVEQSFTWPSSAARTREVYDWVLGGGPRPACVLD